jgi:GNAT superfamily N-acetyltransferase
MTGGMPSVDGWPTADGLPSVAGSNLEPRSAADLIPLFAWHPDHLRAVTDAVLEGHLGRWAAAGDAARLSIGCYEIFGGRPDPGAARDLTRSLAAPRELIFGNDAGWRRELQGIFGERVHDRPMTSFDSDGLDSAHLEKLAASLPSAARLVRFDATLARELDAELVPHALEVFADAGDFAERGIGYGVLVDNRLACAATSYAISARAVEVAIATRPSFRGRGFAGAAAARLFLHCLAEGRRPSWNASNPVSKRLAQRLGMRPAGECEVLFLTAASA